MDIEFLSRDWEYRITQNGDEWVISARHKDSPKVSIPLSVNEQVVLSFARFVNEVHQDTRSHVRWAIHKNLLSAVQLFLHDHGTGLHVGNENLRILPGPDNRPVVDKRLF